jgi:selenocysteine-specific elongation factor
MSHIVVGTAGHIDHGKTALVRALTGMETDSLKEERERAITIDLGFAFLGDDVTIIDVPGHERFIKNMVAGVSTIDFVIFVIAADDGIMPQTREHLDILRLLKVRSGMVALTKTDVVEADWLMLVQEEISEYLQGSFLEGCPVIPVDSISGRGIPEFGRELQEQLESIQTQHRDGIYREFIDRVFTVKGHGTVITGTVISGSVTSGEEVDILPEGKTVRVRGIQIHGANVKRASVGDRAALNLQGVEVDDLERGQVLATHAAAEGSYILDVRLRLLESATPLKDRARVRLHIGTAEVMARVRLLGRPEIAELESTTVTGDTEVQHVDVANSLKALEPGGEAWAQLTLEKQVAAIREDRFVIRSYSPQATIGGGRVLNPLPAGKRKQNQASMETLRELEAAGRRDVLTGLMQAEKRAGWSVQDLVARTGDVPRDVASALNELVQEEQIFRSGKGAGALFLSMELWHNYRQQIKQVLSDFHQQNTHQPGISLAHLRKALVPPLSQPLFDGLLQSMAETGALFLQEGRAALQGHEAQLDVRLEENVELLLQWLREQGNQLPRLSDLQKNFPDLSPAKVKELLGIMVQNKQIVRISNEYMGEVTHMKKLHERLKGALTDEGMTISQIGELLGTPRRITVPLMEYFDSVKLTYRIGNIRKLN